jgi:CrcB protein
MIRNIILAALGGSIGSAIRYGSSLLLGGKFITTLCINILGSLIIGLIIGTAHKNPEFGKEWSVFLATGICGGFTTFSAFSMENILLLQEGKYLTSIFYILASVTFGLIAALAGYRFAI